MKVLVITNLYPPHYLGGYELLCKQVCDFLMENGHEVKILTSNFQSSHDASPLVERSLKLIQNFGSAFKDSLRIRANMPAIEKFNFNKTHATIIHFKPDIIFMWSQLRLTLGCSLAAEQSGLPVSYTLNDEWPIGYKPLEFKMNPGRMINYFFRRKLFPTITTDQIKFKNSFSISKCTRDSIAEEVKTFTSQKIIYQGINLDDFLFKQKSELRNQSRLLYVGQIYEDKGLSTLVKAFEILEKDGKHQLTIVGDGPAEYTQSLKERAKSLSSMVIFKGKVLRSELPDIYHNHDIFIFPSECREAFGLTHLESMSCGTPVISSLSGGQREFLKNEINCLTFEAGNAVDLASKIKRLICDTDLSLKLIKNGRNEVKNNFTTERYLNEILQHLMAIV